MSPPRKFSNLVLCNGIFWCIITRQYKAASVDANKLWKAAGKPRHGSVIMHASLAERGIVLDFAVNKQWKLSLILMTYYLHDALLLTNGATFWKCWQSKFEKTKKFTEVD